MFKLTSLNVYCKEEKN